MQNVVIKKSVLLETLTRNRAAHKEQFATSVIEFFTASKNIVTAAVKSLPEGDEKTIVIPYDRPLKGLSLTLPAPVHHLCEYDRSIKMLEMEVRDELELSSTEFEQFIEDQWHWKQGFNNFRATYQSFM
jgi:hypothetical protein